MSYDNPEKSIALISTRPLKKDHENIEPKNNYKFTIIDQPLSKITPLQDYSTFDSILESINQFHHIVFISTNAVYFFIDRLNKNKISIPNHLRFSCIGASTRKFIENALKKNVYCPSDIYDSEHLLKHAIFNNIKNKNILIIRGKGGRETLKEGFESKEANVVYGECYNREYLSINLTKIKKSVQNFDQVYLLITSLESAIKFMSHNINQNLDWLNSVNFIVNHQVIKNELQPFSKVFVTNNISLISLQKIMEE